MATAVPVTLSGPSGQRIYGGDFPPGGGGTLTGGVTAADAVPSGVVSSAPAPSPAPPPPAPGTTLATLKLYAPPAGNGTHAWCGAHAFVPGHVTVAALAGLQCNPMSLWPDGSVKIAVIAGTDNFTAASMTRPIGTGVPLPGNAVSLADLAALGMTASIVSDTYGSAAFGSVQWAVPFKTLFEGPVCSSWLYRVPFSGDDHLVGWIELRLFSSGDVELLPYFENGYLLKAAPGGRNATYSFLVDGVARFGPTPLTVFHHTRHVLMSGSALSHWRGTDKSVTLKHDAAYLALTGLVEKPNPTLAVNFPALPASNGVSASFQPAEKFTSSNTMLSTSMGSAGGADSIGVQPGWESVALLDDSILGVTQCMRESYRFGNMQIHYRDEATNRPLRFSQHANTAIFYNYAPDRQNFPYIEGAGSVFPPNPATGLGDQEERFQPSHQPAAPLLAYLITGRFWFVEECQHVAAINFLLQGQQRNGSDGLVDPKATVHVGIRRVAWTLRNYAIAACVTPDEDELKPDLDNCIDKNVDHYHALYVAGPGNPFGIIERAGSGFGGDQAWQYDFWTGAWARTISFRLGTTRAKRKKAREFFDWVAKSIVGRLGAVGSSTDMPYRHASCALIDNRPFIYPGRDALVRIPLTTTVATAPGSDVLTFASTAGVVGNSVVNGDGVPTAATVAAFTGTTITLSSASSAGVPSGTVVVVTVNGTYPDYAGGTGPWWSSWREYYDFWIVGIQRWTGANVDGPLEGFSGSPLNDNSGWWAHANAAIVACVSLGAPGAAAAYARFIGASNIATFWGGFAGARPTNGVVPRTLALETLDVTSLLPAPGTRKNVNLNNAVDVNPDHVYGLYPGNLEARNWLGFGGVAANYIIEGQVDAYSGATWAPGYGAAGALISNGGSDGAQLTHTMSLFDLDVFNWKFVGGVINMPPTLAWAGYSYNAGAQRWDVDLGVTDQRDLIWLDYKYNNVGETCIKFANHTYLHNAFVADGKGGGHLILPCSSYYQDRGFPDPRTGTIDMWAPHAINVRNGRSIRAAAAPYSAGGGDGFAGFGATQAVIDRTRNRLWYFQQSQAQSSYVDNPGTFPHVKNTHMIQKRSGGNATWCPVNNCTWVNVPAADAFVAFMPDRHNEGNPATANGVMRLWVYSLSTGFPIDEETYLVIPGFPFAHGGFYVGVDWHPGLQCFYLYEGLGDTFVTRLVPSSLDFRTCSWTWSREAVTGDAVFFRRAPNLLEAQIQAPLGKWAYIPAYQCFGWHDGPGTSGLVNGVARTGLFQLWNLPGTTIV